VCPRLFDDRTHLLTTLGQLHRALADATEDDARDMLSSMIRDFETRLAELERGERDPHDAPDELDQETDG
jgi:hypothetical protein